MERYFVCCADLRSRVAAACLRRGPRDLDWVKTGDQATGLMEIDVGDVQVAQRLGSGALDPAQVRKPSDR